ncbi:hypothetical protein, partial [Nocardia abscessus]|uniref:ATP-binding protein n=1 Tax=Nocardia abscessus TaxID=120957 RepID=UPI002456D97F
MRLRPPEGPGVGGGAGAPGRRRGGGKGGNLSEMEREAESAFGDPTVFLEQAVVNPRHIEV